MYRPEVTCNLHQPTFVVGLAQINTSTSKNGYQVLRSDALCMQQTVQD